MMEIKDRKGGPEEMRDLREKGSSSRSVVSLVFIIVFLAYSQILVANVLLVGKRKTDGPSLRRENRREGRERYGVVGVGEKLYTCQILIENWRKWT